MHHLWKVALFVLLAVMLAACQPVMAPAAPAEATASEVAAAETADSGEVVVVDTLGRKVTFAQPPQRIVIAGRGTYMVTGAMFAFPAAQTQMAAIEGGRFNDPTIFLPLVDPTFADKTILERNAGPEQIAPVNPDAIVLKTSAQELGASLEQLGVPVVYVDMESVDQYFTDLRTMGALLNTPERAEELIAYYQERLDRVAAATADVAEEDKPSVLVIQYSEEGGEVAFEVPPAEWIQTRLVELAGGAPVWTEASESGGWATVNLEQIATWNPDKVFVIAYQTDAAETVELLKASPEWQALAAAQNDEIYGFPADFFTWDSPDPRWILGLQWLAAKMHPDRFADLDMMEEVRSFFTEVYGLDAGSIETNVLPTLTGDVP
jgi:iron complex transport system substrate-binding protein